MKKTILYILLALFFAACERDPVFPPVPDDPTPLEDGDIIENAVVDYDGNTYNAVVIGKQVWMQSNLRTTHYDDGTAIPLETEVSDSVACYYDFDNGRDLRDYGYWYNWKAVMHNSSATNANPSGVQGICPKGWHVPSNAEWIQLRDYLLKNGNYYCENDSNDIAKALASETGWELFTHSETGELETPHISCCVGNPTYTNNAIGFSAFPAGFYGAFYYGCYPAGMGYQANFWSTTEYEDISVTLVLGCCLFYNNSAVSGNYNTKRFGYSVRCLRD